MIENWWLLAVIAFLTVHCTQFAASAFRARNHQRQTQLLLRHRQSVLSRASKVARLSSQLGNASPLSTTMAWRMLEVTEVVQESADCRSFYLVDPYGQHLPDYRPGQYVMVRPALAGAYQSTRCYSLSNSPDARFWRITVKRQGAHPNSTRSNSNGLSDWLHETIKEGDCLYVGGPKGQFYLPTDSTNNIVLVAAGIGITPLASMLRWSLQSTPNRSVTLIYQAKDRQHWPLGQSIHQWQAVFECLHANTFFSRESAEEIDILSTALPGSFYSGKFDGKCITDIAASPQADFYLCGPNAWMDQIRGQLIETGIAPERIHWESFGGPVAITVPSVTEKPNPAKHNIRFALSRVEAAWQDAEQSLWELAKANHIELPSGCLSGVCGSCRVKLVAGQVQYDRPIGIELARGECLTCVAKPQTDLIIQA